MTFGSTVDSGTYIICIAAEVSWGKHFTTTVRYCNLRQKVAAALLYVVIASSAVVYLSLINWLPLRVGKNFQPSQQAPRQAGVWRQRNHARYCYSGMLISLLALKTVSSLRHAAGGVKSRG